MIETVEYKMDQIGYVLWVREERIQPGKPFQPSQRLLTWLSRVLSRSFANMVVSDVTVLAHRDISMGADPLGARIYRGDGSWDWQMPNRQGQRRVPLAFRWDALTNVAAEHRDGAERWLKSREGKGRQYHALNYGPLQLGNSDDLR